MALIPCEFEGGGVTLIKSATFTGTPTSSGNILVKLNNESVSFETIQILSAYAHSTPDTMCIPYSYNQNGATWGLHVVSSASGMAPVTTEKTFTYYYIETSQTVKED